LIGEEVFSTILYGALKTLRINTGNLPGGVYVAKVISANEIMATSKLIITD
jgi:hypothetical protein